MPAVAPFRHFHRKDKLDPSSSIESEVFQEVINQPKLGLRLLQVRDGLDVTVDVVPEDDDEEEEEEVQRHDEQGLGYME